MKIALDSMGGDCAPEMIIEGAVEAASEGEGRFKIVLVGKKEIIESYIADKRLSDGNIEIVDAPEVIGMSESPATAVRRKRNSSIVTAMRLQKEGAVQAVVSAGNTGAVVASSLVFLGRLRGVNRPAIAINLPSKNGGTILLDGGANSDCDAHNLLQFALMGSIYAENLLGRTSPRVGLLSIGEEKSKGNELTRGTYELLEGSELNFVGNVEGRDIFMGKVDVVVTDGFTGNIVLKFSESIVQYLSSLVREGLGRYPLAKLGAAMMKPVFRDIGLVLDYAEYGGAPLLGLNGVVIIGHGGSSARAIKNAVLAAEKIVKSDINGIIKAKAEEERSCH
jgi:glycerol-3-phosphate acyltransferase PlsX